MTSLKTAFEEVKRVKEHKAIMCLDQDRIPVSIEDLKWVIEQYTETSIIMKAVQFDSVFVSGLEERRTSSSEIFVRADQGNFMLRYTAAKELSHVLVDSADDWDPDGPGTIDKLLLQNSSPGERDNSVLSEHLAGYVATELLYPYDIGGPTSSLWTTEKQPWNLFPALRNTGSYRWNSYSSSVYGGHGENLG